MALDVEDDSQTAAPDAAFPFEIITILDDRVYLARPRDAASYVAVKVVDAADPDAIVARFHALKPALERAHPAFARVLDVGRADQAAAFIASEYVAGPSLADLLRRKTLPNTHRVEIIAQLVDAFDRARAQGLGHLRLDATRIKVVPGDSVQIAVLGLALAMIVTGAEPRPEVDLHAIEQIAAALGVPAHAS